MCFSKNLVAGDTGEEDIACSLLTPVMDKMRNLHILYTEKSLILCKYHSLIAKIFLVLSTLFWTQILNIVPYKLLWRTLALSQPVLWFNQLWSTLGTSEKAFWLLLRRQHASPIHVHVHVHVFSQSQTVKKQLLCPGSYYSINNAAGTSPHPVLISK